mgnify:CR=1 FL=1
MPEISIAMATYNGEKYLREQLDSIIAQTISDWELIVCDDCSTDATWQILEEYAEKDKRIKIFKNERNIGFKKNFEKAISLCSGKYIALSDQDDVWFSEHLSLLINNLGNFDIACGNALLVDSSNIETGKILNQVDGFFQLPSNKEQFLWRILLNKSPFQGASLLMHSSFVRECLPIPYGVKMHDTWFASNACFRNGITYTFEPVTRYRQHGNNVTFKSHNDDTRLYKERIVSKIRILLKGSFTDRFDYAEELEARYGLTNSDFKIIYEFLKNIEKKRVSLKDISKIWKNYKYIITEESHKLFIKRILIWKGWKRYE